MKPCIVTFNFVNWTADMNGKPKDWQEMKQLMFKHLKAGTARKLIDDTGFILQYRFE